MWARTLPYSHVAYAVQDATVGYNQQSDSNDY